MTDLSVLPRLWPTIALPGIAVRPATYWTVELDEMPPVEERLEGTLAWLLDAQTRQPSLAPGPDGPVGRSADADGLRSIAGGHHLPQAFVRFIEDPEPRNHVASATACFLDLGEFAVDVGDDGLLIHFLSDQQWVVHWLLFVGRDGSEAVLASSETLGFDTGDGEPIRAIDPTSWPDTIAVCADSFEEFLYRYWAMNELFFRLVIDRSGLDELPAELRRFADRYPRSAAARTIFR